jgi:hypothetical protein
VADQRHASRRCVGNPVNEFELRSQLYAWIGNRTSKVDGDAHDHESLFVLSKDLAKLIDEFLTDRQVSR